MKDKQELIAEYIDSLKEESKEILLERFEALLHSMTGEDIEILYKEKF